MLACRPVFWGGFVLASFFWCGGCADFSQTSVCGIGGAGGSFFFCFVSWFVWSLGGDKGRTPTK